MDMHASVERGLGKRLSPLRDEGSDEPKRSRRAAAHLDSEFAALELFRETNDRRVVRENLFELEKLNLVSTDPKVLCCSLLPFPVATWFSVSSLLLSPELQGRMAILQNTCREIEAPK